MVGGTKTPGWSGFWFVSFIWFVWLIWFISFFEPSKLNKPDKPKNQITVFYAMPSNTCLTPISGSHPMIARESSA